MKWVLWGRFQGTLKEPREKIVNFAYVQCYMYIFIRALACADLCYLFSNLLACYFGSKADLSSEFYAKQIIQPTWNAFKAEH